MIEQNDILLRGVEGAIADDVTARMQDGRTFQKFFGKEKYFLDHDSHCVSCKATETASENGNVWYKVGVGGFGNFHNSEKTRDAAFSFKMRVGFKVHDFSSSTCSVIDEYRNGNKDCDSREWNHAWCIVDNARRISDFTIACALAQEWLDAEDGLLSPDFDEHMILVCENDMRAALQKRKNGELITMADLGMDVNRTLTREEAA